MIAKAVIARSLPVRYRVTDMRIPVIVPDKIAPKEGKAYEWLNKSGPVDLTLEPMYISWVSKEGDEVTKGETIIEGEVQKRIVTIPAPCSGVLREILIGDGWTCSPGEVLGYIEDENK